MCASATRLVLPALGQIVRRICSRVANGWRSRCSASLRCRVNDWEPNLGLECPGLVVFGDRREAHDLPILLRQHMTGEIVLVQPMHDQDDRPRPGVVQSAV
jgi:hypothetical protein